MSLDQLKNHFMGVNYNKMSKDSVFIFVSACWRLPEFRGYRPVYHSNCRSNQTEKMLYQKDID